MTNLEIFINDIKKEYADITDLDENSKFLLEITEDNLLCDVSVGEIFHISEVLGNSQSITNFIYVRDTAKFYCNINCGMHFLLAKYVVLSKNLKYNDWLHDYEDVFLESKCGAIFSSISNSKVMVPREHDFDPQEKRILLHFSDNEFYYI